MKKFILNSILILSIVSQSVAYEINQKIALKSQLNVSVGFLQEIPSREFTSIEQIFSALKRINVGSYVRFRFLKLTTDPEIISLVKSLPEEQGFTNDFFGKDFVLRKGVKSVILENLGMFNVKQVQQLKNYIKQKEWLNIYNLLIRVLGEELLKAHMQIRGGRVKKLQNIIEEDLVFGTSGWRDQVGLGFNPLLIAIIFDSLGEYYKSSLVGKNKPYFLLGFDTRDFGTSAVKIAKRILNAKGIKVLVPIYSLFHTSTPQIAFLINQKNVIIDGIEYEIGGGAYITASHNPYTDNGIKGFSEEGNAAPPAMTQAIDALNRGFVAKICKKKGFGVRSFPSQDDSQKLVAYKDCEIYVPYLDFLLDQFNLETIQEMIRSGDIYFDLSNGSAREVVFALLKKLARNSVIQKYDLQKDEFIRNLDFDKPSQHFETMALPIPFPTLEKPFLRPGIKREDYIKYKQEYDRVLTSLENTLLNIEVSIPQGYHPNPDIAHSGVALLKSAGLKIFSKKAIPKEEILTDLEKNIRKPKNARMIFENYSIVPDDIIEKISTIDFSQYEGLLQKDVLSALVLREGLKLIGLVPSDAERLVVQILGKEYKDVFKKALIIEKTEIDLSHISNEELEILMEQGGEVRNVRFVEKDSKNPKQEALLLVQKLVAGEAVNIWVNDEKQTFRGQTQGNRFVIKLDADADRVAGFMQGRYLDANGIGALLTDYHIRKIFTKVKNGESLEEYSRFISNGVFKIKIGKTIASTEMIEAIVDYWRKEFAKLAVDMKFEFEVDEVAVGFKNFVSKEKEYLVWFESSAHIADWKTGIQTKDDGLAIGLRLLEMQIYYGKSLVDVLEELKKIVGYNKIFREIAINYGGSVAYDKTKENIQKNREKMIENLKKVLVKLSSDLDVVDVVLKDGLKVIFNDGSSVLIRVSGTERVGRIYIQAPEDRQKELEILGNYLLGRFSLDRINIIENIHFNILKFIGNLLQNKQLENINIDRLNLMMISA